MTTKEWSLATIGFYEIYWALHVRRELVSNGFKLRSPYVFVLFDTIRIISFFALVYLLFLFPLQLNENSYDTSKYRWCFLTKQLPKTIHATTPEPAYTLSDQECNEIFTQQANHQHKMDIAIIGRFVASSLFIISCGVITIWLIPFIKAINKVTRYQGSYIKFAYIFSLAPPGIGPIILDRFLPENL